jgi:hypothetical protein
MIVIVYKTYDHFFKHCVMHPQNSLVDSTMSLPGENNGRIMSWVHFLLHSTPKLHGHVKASGWRLGRMTSASIIHIDLHKPNNKLVSA